MTSANVVKNDNTIIKTTETLSRAERGKLKRQVTGHSRMKVAEKQMNVSDDTIRKAIAGMAIKNETAIKIRTYLNK